MWSLKRILTGVVIAYLIYVVASVALWAMP